MRGIPKEIYMQLYEDLDNNVCIRNQELQDHDCRGLITLEHAIIYAGRQVNELWAIIPICAYAHSVNQFQDGGILDKSINEWLAFKRLSELSPSDLQAMLKKYPRNDWLDRLKKLDLSTG